MEREMAQEGTASRPANDDPIMVFRGFAFGIVLQLASTLIAYGTWQLLHRLF